MEGNLLQWMDKAQVKGERLEVNYALQGLKGPSHKHFLREPYACIECWFVFMSCVCACPWLLCSWLSDPTCEVVLHLEDRTLVPAVKSHQSLKDLYSSSAELTSSGKC